MKIEKNGIQQTIKGDSRIELEPTDKIQIVIPASLGIPKICFEINFNGKLIIKGDKSLIEFRNNFY